MSGNAHPRPSPGRRFVSGLLCLPVLMLAALSVLPILAREHWRLELLAQFRLHDALAAGLLLAVLVILRRRWLAAAAAALLLVNGMIVLAPEPHTATAHESAEGGIPAHFRLAALNVYYPNWDHARSAAWLRQSSADIVVLVEVTPEWLKTLEGLRDVFPYQRWDLGERRGDGIAVVSRYPLSQPTVIWPDGGLRLALMVHAAVGSRSLTVVGIHPRNPGTRTLTQARDLYLAALSRRVRGLAGPVVAAGDFNATPWSYAYDDFVAVSGLTTHERTGGTWPAKFGLLGLPIDHVLAGGGAQVTEAAAGPVVGSDHRPVIADVTIE